MGKLVYACIAPHGGEVLPELSGCHPARMALTRQSLVTLGERMREAAPDVLMVFTPHGTRIDGQFSIAASQTMRGDFSENNRIYHMVRDVDRELGLQLTEAATNAGLPASSLNFGTTEGPLSILPLDWGAIVPLGFMPDCPIVVVTPSRKLNFEHMLAFGTVVRQVIERSFKRVGLIASCDWAHTHDEAGPYGFHPSAATLDQEVVRLVKAGDFEAMKNIKEEDIENAKPDGIWQTLMLAGVIPTAERQVDFLSYEAPTYFGLLCAEVYNDGSNL